MLPSPKDHFKTYLSHHGIQVTGGSYERRAQQGASHYALLVPKNFRGSVLFSVHGTGNDGLFPHVYFFQEVLAAGHAIFHFDLDGHGEHSSTYFDPRTIEQAVADAYTCMLGLLPSPRPLQVVGMGHSLGGILLAKAVAAGEITPDALVMVSTPHHLAIGLWSVLGEALTPMDWLFWRQVARHGLRHVLPAFGSFRRDEFPLRLAQHLQGQSYIKVVVDYVNQSRVADAVATIKQPCLWISGSLDGIATPQGAESLARRQANARHVVLARRNHFTTLLHPQIPHLICELLAANTHTAGVVNAARP